MAPNAPARVGKSLADTGTVAAFRFYQHNQQLSPCQVVCVTAEADAIY